MSTTIETASDLISFPDNNGDQFGTGFVHFQHKLADSGLFTDEKLAELIDKCPPEYGMITTIVGAENKPEWQNGLIDDTPGAYVIEAIKNGRLWINLRRLDLVAPEYSELIDDAFSDAEKLNPELKTFRRKSSILISSPSARVLFHADIPMVALWHVRGRKRVWVYDSENKQQLPDRVLEGIILRETEEEVPYDPEWDKSAKAIDLEPGWALSWPQNAPHRVDNLSDLNVSITTDFYTPQSQRKYGVYYANGVLRRSLAWKPRSTNTDGIGALAKCVAAAGLKKSGLRRVEERQLYGKFALDPDEAGKIIAFPKEKWVPIEQL